MTEILRETRQWSRPRRESGRSGDLTAEEQGHVRRALQALRVRAGSWAALAPQLKMSTHALKWYASKTGGPTAGLAVRIARVANVTIDDVIAGRFPAQGACVFCGRCG